MCLLVLLFLSLAVPLFAQTPCTDMARLPNVTAAIRTPTHCQVSMTLRPAADSEIKSEIWPPPSSGWKGKLLMEGGGGLAGSINIEGMTHALREGYASASTDTGHTGDSGKFALGHRDKVTDFAYRAVHETAVAAKAVSWPRSQSGPVRPERCLVTGERSTHLRPAYFIDFFAQIAAATICFARVIG